MKLIRLACTLVPFFAAIACFAQSNPVPAISQPLVPGAIAPGGPQFSLTVHGTGFVSESVVTWNGSPLVTTFLSAGSLSAIVPADSVSARGTAAITVVNPAPGGGSSAPVPFTITRPTSSPAFRILPIDGITSPIGMVSGDFNHDRIPDLAVIDQAPASSCNYQYGGVGSIAILIGNGDGTFTRRSTLCFADSLGEIPQKLIVAGDLNRDGNPDLVAVAHVYPQDQLQIYYGNGDGTFTAPAQTSAVRALASGPYPNIKGLELGDFSNNGQLNIAESIVSSQGAAYIFLVPGGTVYFNGGGAGAGPLSSGDFNGDGLPDLADGSGSLKIFLNAGGGSFTQLPDISFGDGAGTVVSGDFNGDGLLDVATTNGNSVSVLLGKGDGTFSQTPGEPASSQANVSLVAADINGDGKLDLVTTDAANSVSVWLGNGDGTFQAPVDTGGRGDRVVAADFNGDGRTDLAVTNSSTGATTVLLQLESPVVTFTGAPPSAVYGSSFKVTATTNAGIAPDITTSGPCTLGATSGSGADFGATIRITSGTGTCTLMAAWDGDQTYAAASLSQTTTATRASQQITVQPLSTQTQGTSLHLSATSTSGLAVSFQSATPSVCTVSGATAALILPGTCSIEALQLGNEDYLPATPVTVRFQVAGFTITPIRAPETIHRGIPAAFLLRISPVNRFVGNVRLSCSGGPAGSACRDLPRVVHLGPFALALAEIWFPGTAAPGTYGVTFSGVSGSAVNSTTASFTVQ